MAGERSLWRHRDFMLLLSGQTASLLGAEVSTLALPLIAVLVLDASVMQVGVLAALHSVPVLLASLQAGAIVDRSRKRPIMIASNLVAAAVMASVPVAAVAGALGMPHLYVVALLAGLCEVFFGAAYQSYPPNLLGPERLLDGNAKLATSLSLAVITGPILGGGLITLVGAARAVLADALSFLVSAVTVMLIRTPEPDPGPRPSGARLRMEIAEGLRFTLRHPMLRPVILSGAVCAFLLAGVRAIWTVYLVRELGWSAAVLGLVWGISGVGGTIGGLVASRLGARYGLPRVMLVARLGYPVTYIPLVLISPGVAGQVVITIAFTVELVAAFVYNITHSSFRQLVCPPRLLGRMNATNRWLSWGAAPLGALLAGTLGSLLGLRTTLVGFVVALAVPALILWLSPLRALRDVPVHESHLKTA
ncbi:MFS transporter [Sphaerisporangium flaviroseum]|uniref:MFS transporter n=1 Tax=Sphaerisporangium flaviroseum TaxID=509199 RepID=A0ABP7HPQ2_9ACTN